MNQHGFSTQSGDFHQQPTSTWLNHQKWDLSYANWEILPTGWLGTEHVWFGGLVRPLCWSLWASPPTCSTNWTLREYLVACRLCTFIWRSGTQIKFCFLMVSLDSHLTWACEKQNLKDEQQQIRESHVELAFSRQRHWMWLVSGHCRGAEEGLHRALQKFESLHRGAIACRLGMHQGGSLQLNHPGGTA